MQNYRAILLLNNNNNTNKNKEKIRTSYSKTLTVYKHIKDKIQNKYYNKRSKNLYNQNKE